MKQAVRINTSNVKTEVLLDRLRNLGLKLEEIPFLQNGYWVGRTEFSVGATTEYLLGFYSIQEAAAQLPVCLFTELENTLVLDACAAPGGKTCQLADLMKNTGVIVALDVDRQRLVALANQLERCRVRNAVSYELDARTASQFNMRFDRILLDVPCSGNFVTDGRWFERRTMRDVERNARLQREILKAAVNVLDDGGEIVYSTCSLEPEEDELNINWAIDTLDLRVEKIDGYGQAGLTEVFGQRLNSSLVNCRRIWPGETQGFFLCRLKKEKSA